MEVILRIYEGTPHTVEIDKHEFLIGRAEDCDLRLASPLVSRHHCALTIRDDGVFVRDLESSNGTGLNDRVLGREQSVHHGDTLWVGATAIEIRIRPRRGITGQVARLLRGRGNPIPAMTDFLVSEQSP